MTMENGVMKMRPVEGGLEIKPGETVMLKPSSFHIMLVNLKQPLQQAKMVKATLKFENAPRELAESPHDVRISFLFGKRNSRRI